MWRNTRCSRHIGLLFNEPPEAARPACSTTSVHSAIATTKRLAVSMCCLLLATEGWCDRVSTCCRTAFRSVDVLLCILNNLPTLEEHNMRREQLCRTKRHQPRHGVVSASRPVRHDSMIRGQTARRTRNKPLPTRHAAPPCNSRNGYSANQPQWMLDALRTPSKLMTWLL